MKKIADILTFALRAALFCSAVVFCSCSGTGKLPVMGDCIVYDVDVEELSGLCLNMDKTALLSCGDQGAVRLIDFDGKVSLVADHDADMEGICIRPSAGEVYIAVEGDQKICRLDADGLTDLFYVQDAVEGNYRNGGLEGIDFYKDDVIFVGSQIDANLWTYSLDGTVLSKTSLADFAAEIAGLCYDPVADWLWVVDSVKARIFICRPDGTMLAEYDVKGIENAESICVDRERNCVWVGSDEDHPKLYRYSFTF